MFLFKNGLNAENYHLEVPAAFTTPEAAQNNNSDKYLGISTHKLVERVCKETGLQIVGARQHNVRGENKYFARHQIYLSYGDMDKKNWLVGEEKPIVVVDNSHDGTSRYRMLAGFHRKVCSNGAMMPVGKNEDFSVIHRIGMADEVIEATYRILEVFPTYVQNVVEMKQIALNFDEKMILAKSAANILWDPEKIEVNRKYGQDLGRSLLVSRRQEDRKDDLWTTFNVIQENAIKGGVRALTQSERGQVSRRSTRPVEAVDRNTKLNQELMALALEMKRIKTGAQA